jgi:hypothetical protein
MSARWSGAHKLAACEARQPHGMEEHDSVLVASMRALVVQAVERQEPYYYHTRPRIARQVRLGDTLSFCPRRGTLRVTAATCLDIFVRLRRD